MRIYTSENHKKILRRKIKAIVQEVDNIADGCGDADYYDFSGVGESNVYNILCDAYRALGGRRL